MALAISLASEDAQAGLGNWTSTGPEGVVITTLIIDPQTAGVLYAGTLHDGGFKSSTGGAIWASANDGVNGQSIVPVAIDPLMPTTF